MPDIAVYRWERIPRDASGEVADDFFAPPDIAVEIASPEQSVNFLGRRCVWYCAYGVRVAPLVDPRDRSVLIFRPNQAPQAVRGKAPIDLDDVLPGFKLTAQQLFASLCVR